METACVDGHSRLSVVIDPGHIRIKVKVCACVMCVQYTDDFPPTGTLLVSYNMAKIRDLSYLTNGYIIDSK